MNYWIEIPVNIIDGVARYIPEAGYIYKTERKKVNGPMPKLEPGDIIVYTADDGVSMCATFVSFSDEDPFMTQGWYFSRWVERLCFLSAITRVDRRGEVIWQKL